MSEQKRKLRTFDVEVEVIVRTNLPIRAESFEDALERAKAYGVKDVVDFDTDYNDGNIEVLGVYDNKLGKMYQ